MKSDNQTIGAIFLLIGLVWLLGFSKALNVLPVEATQWLLTAIALLGGAYLMFKE